MNLTPAIAADWWQKLQPDADHDRPGNPGALARLRRCAMVAEAMQEPATIALLHGGGGTARDLPDTALVAAVLSHVRHDDPINRSIARRIGPDDPTKPETALVKPIRFRRLIDAEEPDERLTAYRRLVAISGGTLNVADLARTLMDWSEQTRIRWIFDYWTTRTAHESEETSK
jgi:CRISPR system Cascade subunit CasB